VQGSREEYYASRNSILHSVLASGRGLPIILCVVHMALGRSVGLPIQPVNMPMHFLTRMGDDGAPDLVFIDAFSGGRILDRHASCAVAFGTSLRRHQKSLHVFAAPTETHARCRACQKAFGTVGGVSAQLLSSVPRHDSELSQMYAPTRWWLLKGVMLFECGRLLLTSLPWVCCAGIR